MCGVYYLWDGAEVLYVGQSTDVARRISEHRNHERGLDFAGYFVDECPAADLAVREATAIREFKPILNERSRI